MKILIAVQIFAVIVAGEALKCLQCKGINKEDCTGESVECPDDGSVCTRGIEQNILDGDVATTVYRGCLKVSQICNIKSSLTTTRFQLFFYNECCEEDNCNSGPIQMPPKNTTETGLICDSCFVEGGKVCKPEDYKPIKCTGNEGQCIKFYGKAARPAAEIKPYFYEGCATTGTCDIGFGSLPGSSVDKIYCLNCT